VLIVGYILLERSILVEFIGDLFRNYTVANKIQTAQNLKNWGEQLIGILT